MDASRSSTLDRRNATKPVHILRRYNGRRGGGGTNLLKLANEPCVEYQLEFRDKPEFEYVHKYRYGTFNIIRKFHE
jgi:hypothetical protein